MKLTIVILLSLLLCSCSTVRYERSPDGTVSVSRHDLGRDVAGETVTVTDSGLGFAYSVETQNESASFSRIMGALERVIEAAMIAKTLISASDNAASVDTAALQESGQTTRAASRAATTQALGNDVTDRLRIVTP